MTDKNMSLRKSMTFPNEEFLENINKKLADELLTNQKPELLEKNIIDDLSKTPDKIKCVVKRSVIPANTPSIEMYINTLKNKPKGFMARGLTSRELTVPVLPAELDLRKNLMPVRNQGNRGTCVAMAASCMKEYQEFCDVGVKLYFSPEFIYYHRSNKFSPNGDEIDEGMFLNNALDIIKTNGVCFDYECLYRQLFLNAVVNETMYKSAARFKIGSYVLVNTIDGLKNALMTSVCIVAFPVFNYNGSFWKQRAGDVNLGGHCVAIVGYNKTGFIIRNSWGKDWNGNGYTIYPYEDFGCHWEIWTSIDEKTLGKYTIIIDEIAKFQAEVIEEVEEIVGTKCGCQKIFCSKTKKYR